jgi:hypothetical protein
VRERELTNKRKRRKCDEDEAEGGDGKRTQKENK